ncbi:MAG: hypothetical protein U9R15_09520 [Chloroflexota bacterium]|nr:hypothetical protein [Chloroflexota bacterium]
MTKIFVPPEAHTPADRVHEALGEAERMMPSLRGTGLQALKLLHLLDLVDEALVELETGGMDVRAERARFETVQGRLRRYRRRFLSEVGAALEEERAAARPDRVRWWWFLDEAAAQERRQKLRRLLAWSLAAVVFLAAAWFVYDRFVAPPPNVRQALRRVASGENLVMEGDLRAALAEFESAADLDPDNPAPWLWQGVIHVELDEQNVAEKAFDHARSLYSLLPTSYSLLPTPYSLLPTPYYDLDFLLDRSIMYLRVGDLDAASADTGQAILENPRSGVAYYARSSVAAERGDYAAAVADLEQAVKLAHEAGDTQLEATARVQLAMFTRQLLTP